MENFSQSMCSHCGGSHSTKIFSKQKRKKKGYNKPTFNPCDSKISEINVTVGNPKRASDVDLSIISLQIVQIQTLLITSFTGTWKSLKLVRTDQRK